MYLSTRTGTWVNKRVGWNGLPFDQLFHRRIVWFILNLLPYSLKCSLQERELNKAFDHEEYQLKPKHRVMAQHVCVSYYLSKIVVFVAFRNFYIIFLRLTMHCLIAY